MQRFDFDPVADNYDDYYDSEFGRSLDYLEKLEVGKALEKMPPGPMLEIGCGTGHWSAFFCQKGFAVTGIDVSEKMLSHAIYRQLPGCYFALGSAEQLPFPEHSFDHVAAMAVLEFVDEPDRVFNEIHRVLKPGGFLLIGALNKNSRLTDANDEILTHARMFTPALLTEKLLNFGDPSIRGCAIIDKNGELLDYKNADVPQQKLDNEGAFLVGLVKKIH